MFQAEISSYLQSLWSMRTNIRLDLLWSEQTSSC
jgi:hypothetical protein